MSEETPTLTKIQDLFILFLPFNHKVIPLRLNSSLIAVWSKRLWPWNKQHMKEKGYESASMFYVLRFFHWDLFNVSLTVTQTQFSCKVDVFVVEITMWICGTEATTILVFVLCCFVGFFVALGCLFLLVHFPSRIPQNSESLLRHLFAPSCSFPYSLFLCLASQEITFCCLFQSQWTKR